MKSTMNKLEVLQEIAELKDFLENGGLASNDPMWIVSVAKAKLRIISRSVQKMVTEKREKQSDEL